METRNRLLAFVIFERNAKIRLPYSVQHLLQLSCVPLRTKLGATKYFALLYTVSRTCAWDKLDHCGASNDASWVAMKPSFVDGFTLACWYCDGRPKQHWTKLCVFN
jgi:hypothetical protein